MDDGRHSQNALGANDVKGVPYTGRTYIANNVVYGNGGRGIHAYQSSHVDVVNNTTYNNMLTDSQYMIVGEIDSQDCYDVNVVNNVAKNLNGKQVNAADGGTYWNNLWSGSNVPMLGTNGTKADPKFVDPAALNFTPDTGSPALGSGTTALAPTIDIAGKARAAAKVDRGAIQVSK
jgi:parallel beta-helix repeat protein